MSSRPKLPQWYYNGNTSYMSVNGAMKALSSGA